jgi:hypothetical protein
MLKSSNSLENEEWAGRAGGWRRVALQADRFA